MKRVTVLVCLLIMTTTMVYAQNIPEEFISDYLDNIGPVAVEATLIDYHAPWSMPEVLGTHVLYGDLSFMDNVASLEIHTIARLVCDGLPFCVAVSPAPLHIFTEFPWDQGFHTFIFLEGGMSAPLFDVLAVDLSGEDPVALWASGMFSFDGSGWSVHPYAVYGAYAVTIESTTIIPYPFGLAFLW